MDKRIMIALGAFAICCIGLITVSTFHSMYQDNNEVLNLYQDENISFKYPKSFTQDFNVYITESELEQSILYLIFNDLEKNETINIYSEKSNMPLDDIYKDYEEYHPYDDNITNFKLKKTDINGIPAIKEIIEYDKDIYMHQYSIYLIFINDENTYFFSFHGDDIKTLESNYKLVKSNIRLK